MKRGGSLNTTELGKSKTARKQKRLIALQKSLIKSQTWVGTYFSTTTLGKTRLGGTMGELPKTAQIFGREKTKCKETLSKRGKG